MVQVRVERPEAEFLQVRMQKNKNLHSSEKARKSADAANPIGSATTERARTTTVVRTADLQRLRSLDPPTSKLFFISVFLFTDLVLT